MLCHRESKIILIDINVLKYENIESSSLEQINSVLVTKHQTEILRKIKLNFKLNFGRGKWHPFTFSVIIVRGLSQLVVLGADISAEQHADFNPNNNCIYIYQGHVNSVYQIIGSIHYNTGPKLV